ncbi:SgcJ/EcaC family oxidoreductase [Plantactinospora sp. ZYX-F-223]|uniref:SgcJ/EcaC family oxidoreductase n=1 Tax=Plantactinospora sp. ZYX-F-223 TaxID=3144103 RepID=UPI0031FC131C
MITQRKTWLAALAATMLVGGLIQTGAAAAETTATTETTAATGATMERQRDLAAFARILKQQQTAWATEDGNAFAATFTEDADFVTFNGDYLITRQGIAEGLEYYFDNYIPTSHIVPLDEHVRFLQADLAIVVRTTCIIEGNEENCRSGSHSRNTNVLRKRHGEWLQTSFQNTRIQPLP